MTPTTDSTDERTRTMSTVTHDDLSVCIDCAMMLANGELGQGDETAEREHSERMAAQWPVGSLVLAGNVETPFSSRQCDGCGSTLAGSRFDAVAFDA